MAVTFLATIAMIGSAIQIAGDGGCRIKLDIDDSGMDAVIALSAMRGQLLTVTVEPAEQAGTDNGYSNQDKLAQRKERKSERRAAESPPTDTCS